MDLLSLLPPSDSGSDNDVARAASAPPVTDYLGLLADGDDSSADQAQAPAAAPLDLMHEFQDSEPDQQPAPAAAAGREGQRKRPLREPKSSTWTRKDLKWRWVGANARLAKAEKARRHSTGEQA